MTRSNSIHRKSGPKKGAGPSTEEAATRRRHTPPRWYLIYFLLAAFDIAMLSGSLVFHHRIIEMHHRAIAFSEEWSSQFERHIDLAATIAAANAPGNDVFQTRDAESELARMQLVLPILDDKFREIRQSLLTGPSQDAIAPLLAHLDRIEIETREMARAAEGLFEHVQAGDMESAGAAMAAMDRKYAGIMELLNRLEHDSHTIVRSNQEQQTLLAEDMRSFELAIGAIIAVMIVGVAIYGYKLSTQMGNYARSLETQFEALKTSERRFRDLAESSIQGIAVHNNDRLLFVNQAWVTIHGFKSTEDTCALHRMSDTLATDERIRLSEKRRQFLDRGERLHTEYRAHQPDGAIIWLECTERMIDWGRAPAILSIVVDVTGRKHAETELALARKELERVEMQRARFFAAAGHDLRQPLHTTALLLPMLRQTQPSERRQEIVEVLTGACDIMTNLLDEVLELSRLEGGGSEPRMGPLLIGPLFRNLQTEFSPQAHKMGIELRMVPCEATIATDPSLFERILRNLLSNAIRHTVNGRVLLGARRRSGTLRVEIWDSGAGIPEMEIGKIFEEFYRSPDAADADATGLGLGLSIVRRLAILLGHRIEVHSVPGKGTVFSVEAPTTAPTKTESPNRRPLIHEGDVALLDGLRILIVDDDEYILRAMKIAFDSWKCHVLLARSGNEALSHFRLIDAPPDLILSNFWLSHRETGQEVIESVWELFGHRIPAILISADTESTHIRDAAKKGFDVLAKPLRLPDLHEAVLIALAAGQLQGVDHT